MNNDTTVLCSVNGCPSPAEFEEVGQSEHWRFIVRYCSEHQRQTELGTPVGPVGLDSSRVEIHSRGIDEAQTGQITPSLSPH